MNSPTLLSILFNSIRPAVSVFRGARQLKCIVLFSVALGAPASAKTDIEVYTSEHQHRYRVQKDGQLIYQTHADWNNDAFEMTISTGHPKQLGRLTIQGNTVTAYDVNGEIQWQDNKNPSDKICLPEMFSEFIREHSQSLQAGQSIKCLGPVLKAEKLAPFKVVFKSSLKDRLVYQVQPGSLGMWLFMSSVEIHFDKNMNQIIHYNGLTPAPKSTEKKMAYLSYQGAIKQANKQVSPVNLPLW